MKAPLDVQLPKHHHTGTVMVYTIEGKWKYKEHDWVAGPGSIVYETAASTHTFEVVRGRRERICAHTGSGDRRSLVPRRERQHRRARKLEDLAAALSCLLRAAWHQAERPHGIQLIWISCGPGYPGPMSLSASPQEGEHWWLPPSGRPATPDRHYEGTMP